MESDDTMWFIPKNQRRDSWVKDRVKDRNTTHANFRVRFCNSCRKAHEKSIENNKQIINYYDDFTTYRLKREICERCRDEKGI